MSGPNRFFFFFSSRRRHTRSLRDWSSDVCSSDLVAELGQVRAYLERGSAGDADTTLARLENDIADQIANLRRQMSELRPPVEQFGIVQAVRSQGDAFTRATGMACTVEAVDRHSTELPSDVETALLRVTQEALTNVRK